MANNKKIVVLDMDSIVRSSVDMDVFNQLPVTKKLRIFHIMIAYLKRMASSLKYKLNTQAKIVGKIKIVFKLH